MATVFKFRSINKRMLESLINGEVYFAAPESLNDPFDCQIDVSKSLKNAIEKAGGEQREKLLKIKDNLSSLLGVVERDIKKIGIWSCSLELENPLMWAHYGDEHRGICLAYDLPNSFIDHRLGEVIGVSPVDYEDNPIVNWFLNNTNPLSAKSIDDFATPLIEKLLTSKEKCWEYEKEGRVISRAPGIKEIGKPALRQVCFGLRTPESDRELVRKVLDSHGYDVPVCEIERDDNDFGLRARKI